MHQISKKLVLVLAIFAPVTKASNDNVIALDQVLCICYLIGFKKNKIQTLIDFGSKVNSIILRYALKLGLKVRSIDIGTQKIDSSTLKKLKIVSTSF